jgi:cell division protein FtsA
VARDEIVVGLDIGTTKVCTVVGHSDAGGKLTVDGVGIVPSRGVKKGVVVDVEETVTAIRDSVERARHMAGVEVSSAVAGVTGDHIQSSNRRGSVTVASQDGTITSDDIERVLHAAVMDVPRDREIIHSMPRDFVVDGHRGVRRPTGMCGERLEVESHVVTGTASFLNNIVQCVERAGLSANALVLEPIATGEAVTSDDERDIGVALIDIGGGTSDIAVFADRGIIFSKVISVGGNHVTRDISIGLRTPFDIAERLKIERGVASPSLIAHGEALEVMTAGSGERLRLPRAVLGEIIEARMTELFEMAREAMGWSRLRKRVPSGIILAGGGALLPGATELAQQVFDTPVRVGKPIELAGWSEQVDSPQFATAVGLVRYVLRQKTSQTDYGIIGGERRIWSVPPSGITSATRSSASTPERAAAAAPAPTQPAAPAREASTHEAHAEPVREPSAVAPAEPVEDNLTAFDRVASSHPQEYSDGDEPLWKKLLSRVRQLIGFESP